MANPAGFVTPGAVEALLDTYPRRRRPLPEKQAAIYAREYKRNRTGGDVASSAAQRAEAWMHHRVARGGIAGPVLELGAGTLNHVPHESSKLKEWGFDIVEPQEHLYIDSPHRHVVRDVFADLADVPADRTYVRIIGVAVLEHLEALPSIVARSALLLREGGLFQHGIPSEGGFLWGLGWRMTTGLSYRLRTGFSYKTLMRHEHVSDSEEILAVVRHFFEKVETDRWPIRHRHASLYTYLEASHPRRDVCEQYLAAHPATRAAP